MVRDATALCAAIPFEETGDVAPEWLHLLPAGEVRTNDGRGPYRVRDLKALCAASLQPGGKLVLDENHATDRAAPRGESAPARGWIVELQPRADGIYGRVEWTPEGRRIAESKEYRGISPAITYRRDGTVTGILRASLTNTPNLTGLVALHQEESMDLRNALLEALGLDSEADDAAIVAAVKKAIAKPDDTATALQSALAPIAKAVGVAEDADADAILAGIALLADGAGDSKTVVALQSELATLTDKLNDLTDQAARKEATAFVDGAIAEGRVGVKPMRDEYIAIHMENPARARKLIGAKPKLNGTRTSGLAPDDAEPGALGDADNTVIALMGLDPEAYKQTLAASGQGKETL